MSDFQFPSLQEVDDYPVPELLVPRVAKLHDLSEVYAADLVREAKRMLLLGGLSGEGCSPSEEIDLAWHEMILFTRFYAKFCDFVRGKFVHHSPAPGLPDGGMAYERTRQNYEKHFGIKPDLACWTD